MCIFLATVACGCRRKKMKLLFVISGPVGVGKSAFCKEFEARFGAFRLSTRKILTDRGVPDDRHALQAAGELLDRETGVRP
jgi:adenylosuccinate synthase